MSTKEEQRRTFVFNDLQKKQKTVKKLEARFFKLNKQLDEGLKDPKLTRDKIKRVNFRLTKIGKSIRKDQRELGLEITPTFHESRKVEKAIPKVDSITVFRVGKDISLTYSLPGTDIPIVKGPDGKSGDLL